MTEPSGDDFLTVGQVLAPWGHKGAVKVAVLTDYPSHLQPPSRVLVDDQPRLIEESHLTRGGLVVKLAGIDSIAVAEALRGKLLSIPVAEAMPLGPDEYFHHQILGLEVYTTAGENLGPVVEILTTGSNDVYIVRHQDQELLIPAIADVVQEVDLTAGRLIIEVIEGLL